MARQFGRAYSLTAGGVTVASGSTGDDLRVVFSVKTTQINQPVSANVRVYNINKNTAGSIFAAGAAKSKMTFAAGYQDSLGSIFSGPMIDAQIGKETATETYVAAYGSGDDGAHNFSHISTTLKSGSTGMDVFNALMKTMPTLQPGRIPTAALQALKYPRAISLFGLSSMHMRTLAQSVGAMFHYDPVDSTLHISKPNDPGTGSAIVLSGDYGLVGAPTQTTSGILARTLLNPNIKPGVVVHIDSILIQKITPFFTTSEQGFQNLETKAALIDPQGDYVVAGVEHTGDNRGGAWFSEISCYSKTFGATESQTTTFPVGQVGVP